MVPHLNSSSLSLLWVRGWGGLRRASLFELSHSPFLQSPNSYTSSSSSLLARSFSAGKDAMLLLSTFWRAARASGGRPSPCGCALARLTDAALLAPAPPSAAARPRWLSSGSGGRGSGSGDDGGGGNGGSGGDDAGDSDASVSITPGSETTEIIINGPGDAGSALSKMSIGAWLRGRGCRHVAPPIPSTLVTPRLLRGLPPLCNSLSATRPAYSPLPRSHTGENAPKPSNLLAVPIQRRPLFPGFMAPLVVTDEALVEAMIAIKRTSSPFVGVFLVKDAAVDLTVDRFSLTSMDQIHTTGTLAHIQQLEVSEQLAAACVCVERM